MTDFRGVYYGVWLILIQNRAYAHQLTGWRGPWVTIFYQLVVVILDVSHYQRSQKMATMALPIKINLHQKLIRNNVESHFNMFSVLLDGLITQRKLWVHWHLTITMCFFVFFFLSSCVNSDIGNHTRNLC